MVKDSTVIGVAVGVAAALGIGYYFITHAAGLTGHGTLTAFSPETPAGSSTAINARGTDLLTWTAGGQTPGAQIQAVFGTSTNPSSGFTVVGTGVADASGTASGTVQLTAGVNDPVGSSFFMLTYDTSIGSNAGYSNAVKISIVA